MKKKIANNLIESSIYKCFKTTDPLNMFLLNDQVSVEQIKIKTNLKKVNVRCIGIIPYNKSTNAIEVQLKVMDNYIVPCIKRDILPIIILGKDKEISIEKAFVKGFKLKKGAIAQTVYINSHSIIAIGRDYKDIALAINHVIKLKGGIAIAKDGKIIKDISLTEIDFKVKEVYQYKIIDKFIDLTNVVKEELGCGASSPFMHLLFLTLNSIPKWKITLDGLIDVETQKIIPTIID